MPDTPDYRPSDPRTCRTLPVALAAPWNATGSGTRNTQPASKRLNVLLKRQEMHDNIVEFSYFSKFSAKSWQNSASIDIQWLQPIVYQFWQDSAMIWQKISKYSKTRVKG